METLSDKHFRLLKKSKANEDPKMKKYDNQQYAFLRYGEPVIVIYFDYNKGDSQLHNPIKIDNWGEDREEVHHISYYCETSRKGEFELNNKKNDNPFRNFPFQFVADEGILNEPDIEYEDGNKSAFIKSIMYLCYNYLS
jgi:hypothetical protein